MDWILSHEPAIRLGSFFGIFAIMATAEALWPRRQRAATRGQRWPSNLGIVALNTFLGRLVLPMAPVVFAAWAAERGWGLLPLLEVPDVVVVLLAVVALDFVVYFQHVVFHAVPRLWRLHRMHHADLDYDVTLGARFHPIEIVLSLGIKLAAIAALGAPPVAVLLFEVILNGMAMFNHANVRLPLPVDAVLRTLLVTPDVHRVHHSDIPRETHANFGFNLVIWDRIFGTYVAQPARGHEAMTIGLPTFRDPGELRLDRMLTQPFRDDRSAPEQDMREVEDAA